ncbi:MAG: FAD:protein FMN transferase [bacterium]|nr:FAD:protein FMN transferase [bacterium]
MGTTYMIKLVKGGDTDAQKLQADIDVLLKRVNQQMSTWLKDSEISRFNQYSETGWFDVSADTAVVFSEALNISELSGGAFDITVGPLINLWGFGPGNKKRQVPGEEQIKEIMAGIGYQKLSVRQSPPALKKEEPALYCSLAAIAKGFGVDKTAEYLDSKGFIHYLVEIGGEVRARGFRPGGKPWRIGIAVPDGSQSYQKIVLLKNISMATSGDYHNYFEKDGVRYSHTIDPVTGWPITHKLASVTVLHESCMRADALATAINVLGPEKGYELAIKKNLPVFLIVKGANGFLEKMTTRFEEMVKRVSAPRTVRN